MEMHRRSRMAEAKKEMVTRNMNVDTNRRAIGWLVFLLFTAAIIAAGFYFAATV
jgi:hypothetical protein